MTQSTNPPPPLTAPPPFSSYVNKVSSSSQLGPRKVVPPLTYCQSTNMPPPPVLTHHNLPYRILTAPPSKRRKIRVIEGNAKCRHLKKLTCKGTLRQMLSEFIDWKEQFSHVGIFNPALVCCSSPLLSGSTPPLPCVNNYRSIFFDDDILL